MVMLYVGGKKVGALEDVERLLAELAATRQKVELRNEAGQPIAVLTPTPPLDPNEPLVPWDPSITAEEIERRLAEPGYTFEEVKKKLGWE